jgi:hypothetical protein
MRVAPFADNVCSPREGTQVITAVRSWCPLLLRDPRTIGSWLPDSFRLAPGTQASVFLLKTRERLPRLPRIIAAPAGCLLIFLPFTRQREGS